MTPPKKTSADEYSADNLVQLDQMVHIQKRVSLYLGSNPIDTAAREIIDNAVDEVRAGYGNTVVLTLHADGSVQVDDSGRGIPTDINSTTGRNGIIMALGTVGSGGKFGSSNYEGTASMGLNGIGASATCAVSKRLNATVYRNGKVYTLSFKNGKPGFFAKEDDPDSKFTPSEDLKVSADKRSAAEKKERPRGTTIRYWLNSSFFSPTDEFHVDDIIDRLRSTAFLVDGLRVVINDFRDPNEPKTETFDYDGGISEMLDVIAPDAKLHDTIYLKGEGSFTETVQVVQPDGSVKPEPVERNIPVELALRWGNGYEQTSRSFVNTIHTPLGGTHVRGFERAMTKVLGDKISSTRGLLKPKEESPIIDDMLEGLTYVLSISQPEPNFIGQDKQRLGGNEISKVVYNVVSDMLGSWVETRKNNETLKVILNKVVTAARNRQSLRAQKEIARRKTALQGASMPAKLVDCSASDALHTELHIVEGDSAAGSMRQARDSRYQALFPIRGKIINAHKASVKDVLKNQEVSAIIQILGAGAGKDFDIDAMRYGRVIITADADSDGSHIRTLLISLAWSYLRPLIEAGRLYAAVPPLFSIKTQGKNSETIYIVDEEDLNKTMARLDKEGKKYGPASRFKGLGEMDPEELWATTLDPRKRILRQITIDDAKEASQMLELAMGDSAADRREWITSRRAAISDADIDL